MKNEKVSIVVPVYNTEKSMLKKCFKSILNQTYQNIEIIIVDDGSNEKTAKFLDQFFVNYLNVILIHASNGGAAVARNIGIEKADGKYITFIDSDDWIDNDYIECLVNGFEEEIDITMCARLLEFRKGIKEDYFFNKAVTFDKQNKKELIDKSIRSGVAGTWCKMYRRKFIKKNNLKYDPKLRRTQDIIFNLYAFQKANKLIYINSAPYHYRMQNNSITKKYNMDADRILTDAAIEIEKFKNTYYKEDLDIRDAVNYKIIIMLNEILKLKYYNPQYRSPNKKKEVIILLENRIYNKAIKEYPLKNFPSLFGKIKLLLMRKKMYLFLCFLYYVQINIERYKNY